MSFAKTSHVHICVGMLQQGKGDVMTDSANADNDSLYDNDQE